MLNKQMKLFQDGGMMDNSGEVVNGTEVPTGSLRSEVADDIPAKLSEGEFVLPADVVRFIGLEKLMKMRDAAKAGLARMEEMGQMGNAQEVANPDQTFASEEDTSGFESEIDSIMSEIDGEQQQQQFRYGGLSGEDLSKAPKNPMIDVRYFKSDDDRAMYITFINGKPMTAIPDGFKEVTQEEAMKVGKAADEAAAAADKKKTDTSTASTGVGDGPGVGGEDAPPSVDPSTVDSAIPDLGGLAIAGLTGGIPGILGFIGKAAMTDPAPVTVHDVNLPQESGGYDAPQGQDAGKGGFDIGLTDLGGNVYGGGGEDSGSQGQDAGKGGFDIGLSDLGGDVYGGGDTGGTAGIGTGDDGGASGEASEGMSGSEGGYGGVWAKGGLINKRKQPAKKRTQPVKKRTQKGLAAKK